MKHIICLFCMVALVGCGSKEDVFTPETLGEKVIIAFSKNDFKAFKSYYITPEEMKEMLKPEDEGFLVLYEFIYENAELTFRRIRLQGEESGIVWAQAKYKGIEYKPVNDPKKLDIYVYFTSSGKTHRLKLDDCLLTDKRGWRLNDDVTFEE